MSFRNPLTGPVTIGGTVSVQTPSTPGLVLSQPQSLNKVGTSGAVVFASVVGGGTITAVTLTPTAGKTLYVVSFDWSIAGKATTFTSPTVVLSGGVALTYQYPNMAVNATGTGSLTWPQPVPASAVSTAITFTLSYAAAGGAVAGNIGVLNCNGFEL